MSGKCTARIQTGAYLTDGEGNPINLQSLQVLNLYELTSEDPTLPPATYFLAIPFPAGVPTAAFAWVCASQITDLLVATIYNNQADHQVPQGAGMAFYNIAGLWLSSALGGAVHVAIGV